MHLFYESDITKGFLSEEESHHAVKVLRLKVGDELTLLDGAGGYYQAKISTAHHKKCEFDVFQAVREYGKRSYTLHVAIAPTKNIDRFEWFVEKATEIGVDEITPILCHHSERKIIKPERIQKVIIAAAKQSVKAYFPRLNPLISFGDFLAKQDVKGKYIAHCYHGDDKTPLKDVLASEDDILVLIGPEGDFSKEEIDIAIQSACKPVSLGQSRLRTETAGVMACATVNLIKK